MRAAFLLLVLLACGESADSGSAPDSGITVIGDNCCCEHIIEGDIIVEDLARIDVCSMLDRGRCILVDPLRHTPHACCPEATGENCGS